MDFDVEAQVEGADAVGEGADGDDVYASEGDFADAREGDASGGFDEGSAGDLTDAEEEVGGGEVVEHDGVDCAGGEDGLDLVETVYFYFDVGGVGEFCAEGDEGLGEVGACRGEVVVFGHDGVGEGEAVVLAAAAADGVTLDEAEAGGGLAGVYNAALRAGDLGDISGGEGGDAAEALEKVEGYALGLEDGAGGAGDGCEGLGFLEGLGVVEC